MKMNGVFNAQAGRVENINWSWDTQAPQSPNSVELPPNQEPEGTPEEKTP
jgi:hypothetical protein